MEAVEPSKIGQQFVRQYYSLLHADPSQLHRFYLDNSIFVHASESGQDESVIGQKAIFERISALNFIRCCTRVRQVDAFATVADSIVIQVCGELSNNGEPLRPFVQTFVLVPQGLKKYYVHNDIFRYQDFILEPESRDSAESLSLSLESSKQDEPITNSEVLYYSDMSNGAPTVVDVPVDAGVPLPSEEPVKDTSSSQSDLMAHEVEESLSHNQTLSGQDEVTTGFANEEPTHLQEEPETRKSWANVAQGKKASRPTAAASVQTQVVVSSPSTAPGPQPQRQPRRYVPSESNRPAAGGNGRTSGRGGRTEQPDSHQLFVGNLPQGADAEEIRKVFEHYGPDVEVRTTQKNFCFVIFNNAEVVTRILKERQTFELDGATLHVDEKKPMRSRGNTGLSGRGGRGGSSSERGRGAGRGGRGGNDRRN